MRQVGHQAYQTFAQVILSKQEEVPVEDLSSERTLAPEVRVGLDITRGFVSGRPQLRLSNRARSNEPETTVDLVWIRKTN